jgi:hypothetical protein
MKQLQMHLLLPANCWPEILQHSQKIASEIKKIKVNLHALDKKMSYTKLVIEESMFVSSSLFYRPRKY